MKVSLPSIVWSGALLATSVLANTPFNGALNGMPVNPYDPYCAMSCLRSIYSLMLDCSSMAPTNTLGMITFVTSSACWAVNTPYLTTLAYCMKVKCAEFDIPASKFELFWEQEATGQSSAGEVGVVPKWSYSEALANITTPPTYVLPANATDLNFTSLVNPFIYLEQWNVLTAVQTETATENRFGVAMLVTGFALPIVFTWLGYIPLVSGLLRKLKPYLSWPSIIGTYQVRPLPYLLGNAPTIGHTLYIALLLLLNIVLTAVSIKVSQPNAWYSSQRREVMAFILYRTGNLAYIIAPLIFLFASRNNVLLWLTNWSHSTYLLLHRWIARIFALQVLVHSIIAVVLYKEEGSYGTEVSAPYWIWGIVATLCVVVLTFGSGLFFRSFAYEIFLLIHIALSVILIVGCWYHAYDLYAYLGGYEDWMIAISAIWVFDRLARIGRITRVGLRRSKVTELGGDYVRIDVPGIHWTAEPGKHVYAYFPTLTPLRPWENHPFSIIPTALLYPPPAAQSDTSITPPEKQNSDLEKHGVVNPGVKAIQHSRPTNGLTIYVKKSNGMTKSLRANNNLLTLIEGPYPNNPTADVLRCDRLLLIGGGIGITALVPFIKAHWNSKLAWNVKESAKCLVDDLDGILSGISSADRNVRVGERLDVQQLLANEMAAGWGRVGVVVSGPGGLCDEVRASVITASKAGKTEFELEVEAYSW